MAAVAVGVVAGVAAAATHGAAVVGVGEEAAITGSPGAQAFQGVKGVIPSALEAVVAVTLGVEAGAVEVVVVGGIQGVVEATTSLVAEVAVGAGEEEEEEVWEAQMT